MSTHQAQAAIDKCLDAMAAQSEHMRNVQCLFECLQDVHEVAKDDVHKITIALTELLGAINTAPGQHDATKNSVHSIAIALTDLLGTTNKVLELLDTSMSLSGYAAKTAFVAININNGGHVLAREAGALKREEIDGLDGKGW
ncbi:hypothetical protein N7451_002296 [Penicillium sp. IBT 35674x]|nr:hypothetical protein N7451_002296 [Penicillium sp. IBT 35674x]